jgi:hypothetical protein
MGQKRAHLEIPRTVSPSFWFHRLCKLEDIQPTTFLSARTASGFNNWIFGPPAFLNAWDIRQPY